MPTVEIHRAIRDKLSPWTSLYLLSLVIKFPAVGTGAVLSSVRTGPRSWAVNGRGSECGVAGVSLTCALLFQGWYIVTYALGIYHLNLFIAFLSPKVDPSLMEDSGRVAVCLGRVVISCTSRGCPIVARNIGNPDTDTVLLVSKVSLELGIMRSLFVE